MSERKTESQRNESKRAAKQLVETKRTKITSDYEANARFDFETHFLFFFSLLAVSVRLHSLADAPIAIPHRRSSCFLFLLSSLWPLLLRVASESCLFERELVTSSTFPKMYAHVIDSRTVAVCVFLVWCPTTSAYAIK